MAVATHVTPRAQPQTRSPQPQHQHQLKEQSACADTLLNPRKNTPSQFSSRSNSTVAALCCFHSCLSSLPLSTIQPNTFATPSARVRIAALVRTGPHWSHSMPLWESPAQHFLRTRSPLHMPHAAQKSGVPHWEYQHSSQPLYVVVHHSKLAPQANDRHAPSHPILTTSNVLLAHTNSNLSVKLPDPDSCSQLGTRSCLGRSELNEGILKRLG